MDILTLIFEVGLSQKLLGTFQSTGSGDLEKLLVNLQIGEEGIGEELSLILSQLLKKAIVDGRDDIAQLLIRNSANINQRDEMERCLLHLSHPNCLDLLLNLKQVDIECEDYAGRAGLCQLLSVF